MSNKHNLKKFFCLFKNLYYSKERNKEQQKKEHIKKFVYNFITVSSEYSNRFLFKFFALKKTKLEDM